MSQDLVIWLFVECDFKLKFIFETLSQLASVALLEFVKRFPLLRISLTASLSWMGWRGGGGVCVCEPCRQGILRRTRIVELPVG